MEGFDCIHKIVRVWPRMRSFGMTNKDWNANDLNGPNNLLNAGGRQRNTLMCKSECSNTPPGHTKLAGI